MTHDALRAEPQQLACEPRHRHAIGLVLTAGVAFVLGATVWGIPRETARLPAVAREAMTVALPDWHTLEPVNEVVYGTRGFDTFGETFLLLAAVVGIGLVARAGNLVGASSARPAPAAPSRRRATPQPTRGQKRAKPGRRSPKNSITNSSQRHLMPSHSARRHLSEPRA